MYDSQIPLSRGNAYLARTIHNLTSFYAKRRKPILRTCYVLIIYLIFNNGSNSKKRKPKSNTKSVITSGAGKFQVDDPKSKNIWRKICYKIKNTPTILLLSQLNYRDKSSFKILFHLISQITLLVVKAFLTLKVAALDGDLVSSLVSKKFKNFFKLISVWLIIGIPSSITDSLLLKTQSLLAQSIRINITEKLLDDYLPSNGNSTIYQLINQSKGKHYDNNNGVVAEEDEVVTIGDPNHRLTTTVEQFSQSFSILPSQILTPSLDILLAANQMSKTSENASEGALILGLIANMSTLALKIFTPNFSKLSNIRNSLENKFRVFHSNIINNCEEVALAKGHRREIDILDTSYFEFERFQRMELRRLAVYDFSVSFIFKYSLGAFGLMLCSLPTFTSVYSTGFNVDKHMIGKLSSDFVTNRRLLLSASDSLGKLIQSKKNIQNMTGYAESLWELQKILQSINTSSELEKVMNQPSFGDDEDEPLIAGPNILYGDEIRFDHIPLITPSGNLLVKDLSFSIRPGDNLLIIGPNGCGKSSLFRILGGLWEVQNPGKLTIPYSKNDLFYLPQKSYFTYGTLREQIIYPQSFDDYQEKITNVRKSGGICNDDESLVELLRMVNLEGLLETDDDDDDEVQSSNEIEITGNSAQSTRCFLLSCLDRIEKWPDVLSVGEQQRLAMVRLYYHRPKFAVLDECTSSISSDLERECYRIATQELGITVLSVCHRTTLWNFHSYILKFKRRGGQEEEEYDDDDDEEKDGDDKNGDDKNGDEHEHREQEDAEGSATTLFTKFDPELRLQRHNELIQVEHSLKRSEELIKRLECLKKIQSQRSSKKTKPKLMYIEDDQD